MVSGGSLRRDRSFGNPEAVVRLLMTLGIRIAQTITHRTLGLTVVVKARRIDRRHLITEPTKV